jgi:putative membrane protein
MLIRILLAALHLLAFGIGLGAVWTRGRALRSEPLDRAALSRVFQADTWWGVAAGLWLVTGLIRLLGSYEKSADYYVRNHLFLTKLGLFVVVVLLELRPMIALIKWRALAAQGLPVDTSRAGTFARISVAQAHILLVMLFLAVALARGVGAR